MRERLPNLMALALLTLLVLTTWWAADYTQRSIELDPPRRMTHEPDAWGEQFVMLRSNPQGLVINRLEGVYMQHFPDDDSYEVTQAHAVAHQPDGTLVTGTADLAVMDQDGDRITLQGDAHVHRNANGETPAMDVRSATLTWLLSQDVVWTDAPALVDRGRSQMQGTGMHYNNKTKILQVHANTHVRIAGSDQRTVTPSVEDETHTPPADSL